VDLTRNFAATTSEEDRTYAASGHYDAILKTYTYDATYGNQTKETDQSGQDGGGWSTYRSYSTYYHPNDTTDAQGNGVYLVGLPARQQVKGGGGNVVSQTLNFYDSNSDYDSGPTAGILKTVRTLVSGTQYSQVSYDYDAKGNRTQVTTYTGYYDYQYPNTQPTGAQITSTVYDSTYHVYPISTTNALGQTTTFTYDYTLGLPLTMSDPNNALTSVTYDSFGRITSLTRPTRPPYSGATITMAYNDYILPPNTTFTPPLTTTITAYVDTSTTYSILRKYDGMGRQFQINSGGVITDTVYSVDATNHTTTTQQSVPYQGSSPNLFTTTVVNAATNITTVTAPDQTSTSSHTNGLTSTVTDAKGNSTTTTKDVWGRVITVTPPTGPGLSYSYDELDHLKTAKRGSVGSTDITTTLNYDNAGRKTSMSDPDMGNWTYGYDAMGNLTSQSDAKGQVVCLYYDALNRPTGKYYATSTPCPPSPTYNIAYHYDEGGASANAIGRRTSMTDTSGSTSWVYDARGSLTSETTQGYTTHWTYNNADQPLTMKYPDNEVVNITYNSQMQLNSLIGTDTYVQSSSYDSASRLTSRALGNTLTQKFHYYDWNTQGGGLEAIVTGSGTWDDQALTFTNMIQKQTYTHDPVGNITQMTNVPASETNTYGYDALNRLTAWTLNGTQQEVYTYDPATGNLQTKGAPTQVNNTTVGQYTYDYSAHAVTQLVDSTNLSNVRNSYGYDYNGNQNSRSITTGSNTGSYTLGYDAENRLVSVSGPNGWSASFVYDGDGNRVQSTINGTTTTFIGNYYENTNGAVTKYYYAGSSRIAMRKYTIPQPMTVEYLLGDNLGSTSITTDNTGAKVSEIRYKPWGETRYTWTDTTLNTSPSYTLPQYTFTGQYSDSYINLLWYGSREYDPAIGRFISPDTIVPTTTQGVQAWDRYAYVNNDPINATDPTGHWAFNFNLSGLVNAAIATNPFGFTSGDVSNFLDTTATVLDTVDLGIDSAIAVGDVVSGAIGGIVGAGIAVPEGGAPAVVTGPAGALLGVGLFELNPVVRLATAAGNGLASLSTLATATSDVITGDTNVAGSLSVSESSVQISQSSSIGRDTLTSGGLSLLGWASPIGVTSALLQTAAVANDIGLVYQGPLAVVPKSIPITNYDIKIEY
jgi:RHS repeat-associated protein